MNPTFIAATFFLGMSLNSHASEILRIFDGSTAKCESRADEMRYKTSAVYRPLSAKRLSADEVSLTIQFVKCSNERGSFGFSADSQARSRTVVLERGPFQPQDMTVTIERSQLRVVAYNEDGQVYDSAPLKFAGNDTYTAILKLNQDNVLFNVQSLMKITNEDTGVVIDSGREVLGSYRLKM